MSILRLTLVGDKIHAIGATYDSRSVLSARGFTYDLSAGGFAYVRQAWTYDCFGPSTQRVDELKSVARQVQDQLDAGGVAVEVKAYAPGCMVKPVQVGENQPAKSTLPDLRPRLKTDAAGKQYVTYRKRTLNVVPTGDAGSPYMLRGAMVSYDVRPIEGGRLAAFRTGWDKHALESRDVRVSGLTFVADGERLVMA